MKSKRHNVASTFQRITTFLCNTQPYADRAIAKVLTVITLTFLTSPMYSTLCSQMLDIGLKSLHSIQCAAARFTCSSKLIQFSFPSIQTLAMGVKFEMIRDECNDERHSSASGPLPGQRFPNNLGLTHASQHLFQKTMPFIMTGIESQKRTAYCN